MGFYVFIFIFRRQIKGAGIMLRKIAEERARKNWGKNANLIFPFLENRQGKAIFH